MATLLSAPYSQFFDDNGDPLAGGKVYTYIAGTDTPQATYTDFGEGTPAANPVILDAAGRAAIWLAGSYKFKVTDANDVLIRTTDNVVAGEGQSGTWVAAGGSADAITATYSPTITSLSDGQLVYFRATAANATQAPTFAPNGLTARTITKIGGSPLAPGDIPAANAEVILRYNLANTRWELMNPAPSAPLTAYGRLTLATGTPVTTTDVTNATIVYWTPYRGNTVPIYNGASFVFYPFPQLSVTLDSTNFLVNTGYDFFVYNDAGTIRLGYGPAWSSTFARGTGAGTTELTRVNGIRVNANAMTIRYGSSSTTSVAANKATYVGSCYGSANGETCDTLRQRFVFNEHSQVKRALLRKETTDSWNYTTATLRQANGSATNQIEIFDGSGELVVDLHLEVTSLNASSATVYNSIGLNSTDTASSLAIDGSGANTTAGTFRTSSRFNNYIGLGFKFLVWLEYSQATGTTTWYGDGTSVVPQQSGMSGSVIM